jgi:NADPH-dependent curcumin reductase CurA
VREAGYDACFNHKTETDVGVVLDKLCPQGIDADFENVGGRIFHAVFERLNNFGRVAFCGDFIAGPGFGRIEGALRSGEALARQLTLQGVG